MKATSLKPASAEKAFRAKDAELFRLEIRIRGRAELLHKEVCYGLEDAIRIGEKWFRAFAARNPWFLQDSKQRRIFILLDPETEMLIRS
jgi:hypothetical protein